MHFNNIDEDSIHNAVNMRESMRNPAEFPPGMNLDEDASLGDLDGPSDLYGMRRMGGHGLGSTSSMGLDDTDNLGGFSDFNGTSGLGDGLDFGVDMSSPMGMSNPYENRSNFMGGTQPQTTEDKKFEDYAAEFCNKCVQGFVTIFKDAVKSKKSFDLLHKMQFGRTLLISSCITSVIGLILGICTLSIGWELFIGGAFSSAVAIPTFMICFDKCKKQGLLDRTQDTELLKDNSETQYEQYSQNIDFDTEYTQDAYMDEVEDESEVETEYNFTSETDNFVDVNVNSFDTFEDELEQDTLSVDSINVPNGIYTRQFLFEKMSTVLKSVTPNYNEVEVLEEDSREFTQWVGVIAEVNSILKPKEDADDLEIVEVKRSLFYNVLTLKRTPWLKSFNNLVDEIVNIVAYDTTTNKKQEGVYGSATKAGKYVYIDIVRGETACISLKDIMGAEKDYYINTDNILPVTIGIGLNGQAVMSDLRHLESMLVTGVGRSGKSWFVKSLLAQMMMFNSPDDVEFYFLDPKDSVSDFKDIQTPHTKSFVTKPEKILKVLRYILEVVCEQRKKDISAEGVLNLWEYRRKRPDKPLPAIYLVIDEIIAIGTGLSANDFKEFQDLLFTLVSEFPMCGVRLLLVPHLVKNNILRKNITSLIPTRISVRGNSEHIKDTLDVTNFKHNLTHQGDMAVLLQGSEPTFVHGPILCKDDEGIPKIFEYISALWQKIDTKYKVNFLRDSDVDSIILCNRKDISEDTETFDLFAEEDTDEDLGSLLEGQSKDKESANIPKIQALSKPKSQSKPMGQPLQKLTKIPQRVEVTIREDESIW